MSKVLIEEQTLYDIGDAIRTKNGTDTQYKVSDMSFAISNIQQAEYTDPFSNTIYIESDGGQYIDTGYLTKSNTIFELVANISSTTPELRAYAVPFGARDADEYHEVSSYVSWGGSSSFHWAWGTRGAEEYAGASRITAGGFFDNKIVLRLRRRHVLIEKADGDSLGAYSYSSTGTPTQFPIHLFSLNQGGTDNAGLTGCKMKFYQFSIFEGNELVHNYIPWVDAQHIVCLKDTATGNIKYNSGSGLFVYGSDS